jgi:hypothetical protein
MALPRLVGFAATVLATGCAVVYPQARIEQRFAQVRAQWVQAHNAELTPAVASAIREGRVTVGMTVEQAVIAWTSSGPPYAVNHLATGGWPGGPVWFPDHNGLGPGISAISMSEPDGWSQFSFKTRVRHTGRQVKVTDCLPPAR